MASPIGQIAYGLTSLKNVQPLRSASSLLINSNSVATLEDCNIVAPVTNQVLMYNSTSSKFENQNLLFGSSLSDVLITTPIDSDKIVYNATIGKWINSQPYFYSVNISGKFKDSFVQSMVQNAVSINFLNNDPLMFDTYLQSNLTSNGLTLDTNFCIAGYRALCNYSFETTLNLSMLTIANSAAITLSMKTFAQLPIATSTFSAQSYCALNQNTLSLNVLGINQTITPLCPAFGITTTNLYTGNTTQDFNLNIIVYEV
jgi:hypothetical protein